jgi:hypothetical protein
LHSQVYDAIDVSDYIVDAQGQIVHVFERFRELLPECNASACPPFRVNLAVATNGRQIKIGPLARADGTAKYHQCCENAGQRSDIRQLPAIRGANIKCGAPLSVHRIDCRTRLAFVRERDDIRS